MDEPITNDVMEIAAAIEGDIPSRVTGANRVFIRAVIARAIMAAKADERQVFVEMIEQFGSAKLIRHCRAALSNSERTDG